MRIQEGRDLNLTSILLSMISCEREIEIVWYTIHVRRFAFCSCQYCVKTESTDGNHLVSVFWNRLQVTRGSLMLTGIQKNDDRRTIRVVVFDKITFIPVLYTIWIFVNPAGN